MELFSVTDTNVFVPAATHTLCEELERAMVVRRGILVVAGAASTCAVHPSLFGVTRVHVVLPLTEGPEGKKVSSCADVPAAKSSVLTPLGIDHPRLGAGAGGQYFWHVLPRQPGFLFSIQHSPDDFGQYSTLADGIHPDFFDDYRAAFGALPGSAGRNPGSGDCLKI